MQLDRVTHHDLACWRVLDFGESYQIYDLEREFHNYNEVSCDV